MIAKIVIIYFIDKNRPAQRGIGETPQATPSGMGMNHFFNQKFLCRLVD
jgi:hypothetical protein